MQTACGLGPTVQAISNQCEKNESLLRYHTLGTRLSLKESLVPRVAVSMHAARKRNMTESTLSFQIQGPCSGYSFMSI